MKRFFDIIASFLGLLISSPVLLFFAVLIWLQDFQSPFFIAPRVGCKGKLFPMVKLRTMVVGADKSGVNSTATNDIRITKIGHMVRRYKLDEFTQLWNVLLGQMSLVGPRPQVKTDVDLYSATERRLLDVSPGITDFSSIVFSDEGKILDESENPELKYNQVIRPWKSRLGLFYIEKKFFLLDLYIIALTIIAIFSRSLALSYLQKMLIKLEADARLISIAGRKEKLYAFPPPGTDDIVTNRLSTF